MYVLVCRIIGALLAACGLVFVFLGLVVFAPKGAGGLVGTLAAFIWGVSWDMRVSATFVLREPTLVAKGVPFPSVVARHVETD